MEMICDIENCTGCGLCVDVCPQKAVMMLPDNHGFVYPSINSDLCVDCGMCKAKCPNNVEQITGSIKQVYAAWNRNKLVRACSSSGGLFLALANYIIEIGGVVAGVEWDENFCPRHTIISKKEDLYRIQGSKYSQSTTNNIYNLVKENLSLGKKVLFSGTPCQISALKSFIGGHSDNLYTVDLVCHGVPSNKILIDYYSQFDKKIVDVKLRKKEPYWDYPYVCITFKDNTKYNALTINEDYFNLFNVGFTLRRSCHKCRYTNLHRFSDITLADFWGYRAHSFATRNYNKGTSLVLINSDKGQELFDEISDCIYYEVSDLETAIKGNKCLSEPFDIESDDLNAFWSDYDNGMSVKDLNAKYCANRFRLPRHLGLRRIYYKWKWIIRK